jgi:ion channel
VLTLAKKAPSALLLGAQLAAVLLYPFMLANEVGRSLFSLFGIAILGLVVLAVRRTPGLNTVVVLLGIPAAVLLLIQAITRSDDLLPYSSAFEAVIYFYAAGAMLAYMLEDQVVTRDELFAIGATFTLLAWAFAYTYTVCQAIDPGSFTAAENPGGDRSWMELLFLSFTTLSSTGLGDVVPIRPPARALVMFEMIAGVAYLTVLVSRLVALTVMRGERG